MWNNQWFVESSDDEAFQVLDLLQRISKLRAEGLTSVGVAFSFMRRCMQPLQQWTYLGYEYLGLVDQTRFSPEDLSTYAIMARLRSMFENVVVIPMIVQEFSATNPRSR